jgi:GntR family transcriptional regulator
MFKLTPSSGQSLYLQLMQQIRHAIEKGALQHGDQLPGIRTLAQELLVSPHTVAKAFSELEHEGVLELRQGTGAFIKVTKRPVARSILVQEASLRVSSLTQDLKKSGLREDEIQRIFEAELLHMTEVLRK